MIYLLLASIGNIIVQRPDQVEFSVTELNFLNNLWFFAFNLKLLAFKDWSMLNILLSFWTAPSLDAFFAYLCLSLVSILVWVRSTFYVDRNQPLLLLMRRSTGSLFTNRVALVLVFWPDLIFYTLPTYFLYPVNCLHVRAFVWLITSIVLEYVFKVLKLFGAWLNYMPI